jgi:8-oxo-dGTP diphosphatase
MKTIEASLVYIFDGDNCLMLHRVKKEKDIHEGKWNGLGGKQEYGESPEECARREILEESGLTLNSIKFAGHLFFPKFDQQKNDWSVFVFTSDDFSGQLRTDSPEGELHWITKDKLLELNLWEGDRYFIPLLLSERIFLGKFVYADGHLEDYKLNTIGD